MIFFFQFLGIFYIALAIVLIGTNIGRDKRKRAKKPENKKQLVQLMEGKEVKCEVVGDKDIGTGVEDDV